MNSPNWISKSLVLVIFGVLIYCSSSAQIPGYWGAKEFSKEIALYKAKAFVFGTVLGSSSDIVQFEIDPLAAASSGELTSLVYKCQSKAKEGMVLGFYGDYWNAAGIVYKGFRFIDLPKEKALPLLDKIKKAIDEYSKYLNQSSDNNNIYFEAEGMTFLIYSTGSIKIRVFWGEFDSEWDMVAFRRTKRRLLNKLNDD
jgi:hypothetical protein